MGLEQSIQFPGDAVPTWDRVAAELARRQLAAQLRMIDGELALPDEQPPEHWRELRVGTANGMVTVRRDGRRLSFIVWGNAERPLLQARNALMVAFAQAGGGQVLTADESRGLSAAEFLAIADLPEPIRDAGQAAG